MRLPQPKPRKTLFWCPRMCRDLRFVQLFPRTPSSRRTDSEMCSGFKDRAKRCVFGPRLPHLSLQKSPFLAPKMCVHARFIWKRAEHGQNTQGNSRIVVVDGKRLKSSTASGSNHRKQREAWKVSFNSDRLRRLSRFSDDFDQEIRFSRGFVEFARTKKKKVGEKKKKSPKARGNSFSAAGKLFSDASGSNRVEAPTFSLTSSRILALERLSPRGPPLPREARHTAGDISENRPGARKVPHFRDCE